MLHCTEVTDRSQFQLSVRRSLCVYNSIPVSNSCSVLVDFETDVHAECRRWIELARLKTNVYCRPFVVPADVPKDAGCENERNFAIGVYVITCLCRWNPDAAEDVSCVE